MGIFDDAIRQHLDLKRRQGADESELKQLEDEAFGLPARPGDPDFPETGEKPVTNGAGQGDQPTAGGPAEQADEPERDLQALVEREEPEVTTEDEAPPHGDALLADGEDKPEGPPEDAGLVEDEGAKTFTTSEREAIAGQPTEFFDQAPAELELGELDLDLDEEVAEAGELEEQPLTDEQLVEEAVPPTEESPLADEPEPEVSQAEPEPPLPEEPEGDVAPEPEDEEQGEGSAEDVLEETPEFLRENPDDDELWFEQGQPKDFDF